MVLHIETRLELRFSTAWNVWSCQCTGRIISSILFYFSCFVFLLACSDVMSYYEWLSLSLYIYIWYYLIDLGTWHDLRLCYSIVLTWLCRSLLPWMYLCIFAVLYLWLFVYMMHVMKACIHLHNFQCISVRSIPSTSRVLQTLKLWKITLGCLGCKGSCTTLCSRVYYILLWEPLLNSQYNEKW